MTALNTPTADTSARPVSAPDNAITAAMKDGMIQSLLGTLTGVRDGQWGVNYKLVAGEAIEKAASLGFKLNEPPPSTLRERLNILLDRVNDQVDALADRPGDNCDEQIKDRIRSLISDATELLST